MKRQIVYFYALPLAFLFLFTSCQKEDLMSPTEERLQSSGEDWEGYDRFGAMLESSISQSVTDKGFTHQLVSLTQTRPTGDFEALLSTLVEMELPEKTTVKSLLVSNSGGSFTEADLDNFLQLYPATVIGVRGNPVSWMEGEHVPAVKFVDSKFDWNGPNAEALQNGQRVHLDLTKNFTDAVIAIHKSERHDDSGVPLVVTPAATSADRIAPSVNANDLGNATPQVMCNPEPTSCQSPLPFINAFTATPQNGGILLSYTLSNFPATLCSWGRVRITRLNPNGSYTYFYRDASSPTAFYDNSGNPNVTYNYTLNVYAAYIVPGGGGQWQTCVATNNLRTATATFPGAGGILDSYKGSNQSSSYVRYDWYAPPGVAASEYRIRKSTTSSYQTIATVSGTTFDYFYNYPSADRGQKIQTQIQYRSGGFWQGNFADITYGSFRNSGQPFKYYGVRMDDVSAYEYNESPLFGAPEIRITVTQGNAAENSVVLENTFLPMSGCTESQTFWYYDPWTGIFYPYTINVNTGYFFPTSAPNGYTLLSYWDSGLSGSAIRVVTKETDINVPVITEQTNTSSTETKVTAKVGFKLPKNIGVDLGVESTWKDATEIKVRYPNDDLPLGDRIIYYHDHPTTVRGIELFGSISGTNYCQRLQTNL